MELVRYIKVLFGKSTEHNPWRGKNFYVIFFNENLE